jgi:hypothetical protein
MNHSTQNFHQNLKRLRIQITLMFLKNHHYHLNLKYRLIHQNQKFQKYLKCH